MKRVLLVGVVWLAMCGPASAACPPFFDHARELQARHTAQEWVFPVDGGTLYYAFRRGEAQFIDHRGFARRRGLTIRVTIGKAVNLRYRSDGPASFEVCWRVA